MATCTVFCACDVASSYASINLHNMHFLTENFDVLGELLSNLKWLLSTVEFGAANALLACYRDYRNKVPERVIAYMNIIVTHIHANTTCMLHECIESEQ